MEKPLVLKRRLRLETWEIVFYVLFLGFLGWWIPRNFVGGTVISLSFLLMNVHRFVRRVTLTDNKIAIWDDNISNRVIAFDRVISYFMAEEPDQTKVRLWLQRAGEEREITVKIEPEQTKLLLDFLRRQGAIVNQSAAREWEEHKIVLDLTEAFQSAKKAKGSLSQTQQEELLADAEAKLLKLDP